MTERVHTFYVNREMIALVVISTLQLEIINHFDNIINFNKKILFRKSRHQNFYMRKIYKND